MKIEGRFVQYIDGFTVFMSILSAVCIIASVTLAVIAGHQRDINASIVKQIENMESLRDRVAEAVGFVEEMEKRVASSHPKGVVTEISESLESLGIKASAIKPLEREKIGGFTEETASVTIEKADLNEVVNMLYGFRNSSVPLIVRGIKMKKDFEQEDKFNIDMTIALITK